MADNREQLKKAVQLAISGDWDASHKIAQDYADHYANWIHAVLHKIEGDEWNSKYWYQRTSGFGAGAKHYDDYGDATVELNAIAEQLAS